LPIYGTSRYFRPVDRDLPKRRRDRADAALLHKEARVANGVWREVQSMAAGSMYTSRLRTAAWLLPALLVCIESTGNLTSAGAGIRVTHASPGDNLTAVFAALPVGSAAVVLRPGTYRYGDGACGWRFARGHNVSIR